ncbi:MAG: glycosyltransferase [Candidatus Omnitrophica bacterium]|nr:glycosyltransferase [Candidatus Omnitrophota bacterium]
MTLTLHHASAPPETQAQPPPEPVIRGWRNRLRRYYFAEVSAYLKFLVAPGQSVLELGCRDGHLLAQLAPSRGVGLDSSPPLVSMARSRYPSLTFDVLEPGPITVEGTFDVIILTHVVDVMEDVYHALTQLRRCCHRGTRLILITHSYLWAPILVGLERLGLKRMKGAYAWLSLNDLQHLLLSADFEVVRREYRTLLPVWIPGVSWVVNRILGKLPVVWKLGMDQWVVARPLKIPAVPEDPVVSVVVPCRNERGTIAAVVERTPEMGRRTEFIVVEGHSTDGTREELAAVQRRYPERDITIIEQEGQGKGDAVRRGFAAATGDIVMILDADLSVSPEVLPRFTDALVRGSCEFAIGSRLVYPMPAQAMQPVNMIGNMLFGRAFSFLLGYQIKDTLCGTKALWRRDYERLASQRAFFGFIDPFGDFDLILGAAKLSLKVLEVPVRYQARVYGTTNIRRWWHGCLLMLMLGRALVKMKLQ